MGKPDPLLRRGGGKSAVLQPAASGPMIDVKQATWTDV